MAFKAKLSLVLFVFSVSLAQEVFAHPVAYQGATGVMTWNQPYMSDIWLTYSFRSDMAAAARIMRFDAPEGRMQYFAPQFDYLVKRWNETDYQANIYAYGGYGAMNFQNKTEGAGLGGVEADAESRKYFVSAQYEKMWSNLGPDFYHTTARVGIAPYEAEFNEIASWLMIQYEYHPMLTKEYAVTPLIRLFYKSVLLESGVSTDGEWMMNFMFHF
jgi:hypothetical protein